MQFFKHVRKQFDVTGRGNNPIQLEIILGFKVKLQAAALSSNSTNYNPRDQRRTRHVALSPMTLVSSSLSLLIRPQWLPIEDDPWAQKLDLSGPLAPVYQKIVELWMHQMMI